MFHFRLFREKAKEFFFKNPTIFDPLCPFLSKTECSSKFWPHQYFLKKLRPSIIVPNLKEVMTGFQATLVSETRMHTCMEQAYHQTLHASYDSNSNSNTVTILYPEVALCMQISTFTIIPMAFYQGSYC